MNRKTLRRGLTWCVVAILLGPLLIAVVLGLGALLTALGDTAAAAVCGRVALVLGVMLRTGVGATTADTALAMLAPPPRRRPKRRRRRPMDDAAAGRLQGPA
jgi:hypothetical protein